MLQYKRIDISEGIDIKLLMSIPSEISILSY